MTAAPRLRPSARCWAILLAASLIWPAPAPRPFSRDLLAIGDSITVGMRATAPNLRYAAIVAAALGLDLDDRAVSGSTLDDRMSGAVLLRGQLHTIEEYRGPALRALWLTCTNDLYFHTPATDFARGVAAGLDLLRARGIRVMLNKTCLPLPRRDDPQLVAAYNAALAELVERPGVEPVDVERGLGPSMFPDGTHPNDRGHRALASAILGRWSSWAPLVDR